MELIVSLATLLACGTASGMMLRPLILFDGKCLMGSRYDVLVDDVYIYDGEQLGRDG